MLLDYRNIFEYTQDPMEYLFLEKAEIEPGERGRATKNLSMQDWYFKIHFPGDPIMPGVLIMESIMEVGTLIISTLPGKAKTPILFRGCNNVKIVGEARPGDMMVLEAHVKSYKRGVAIFSGTASIGDRKILSMEFTLIVKAEFISKKIP